MENFLYFWTPENKQIIHKKWVWLKLTKTITIQWNPVHIIFCISYFHYLVYGVFVLCSLCVSGIWYDHYSHFFIFLLFATLKSFTRHRPINKTVSLQQQSFIHFFVIDGHLSNKRFKIQCYALTRKLFLGKWQETIYFLSNNFSLYYHISYSFNKMSGNILI